MLTCDADVFAAWLITARMFWVGWRPTPRFGHSYTEPGIDGRRFPGPDPDPWHHHEHHDTITLLDGHRVRHGEVLRIS